MSSRKSERQSPGKRLPPRILSLFHQTINESTLSKKLTLLHSNPNIYLIKNFITEKEIEHLNKICTINRHVFNYSFVENDANERVINEDRTSTYLGLKKGQDNTIRNIERRASELVGVDIDNVEPIQIVSYTENQHFLAHHDAGTYNPCIQHTTHN